MVIISDIEAGAWKIAAIIAAILLFILLLKPFKSINIEPQQTIVDTVYLTDTIVIHDTVFVTKTTEKKSKKPVVKDSTNVQIDTIPISNET